MAIFLRVIIFALAVYFIFKRISALIAPTQEPRGPRSSSGKRKKDPYAILNLKPGASQNEIKEAYRKALAEYHPDKVMHLGEDIQKLAKERTNDIIEAYEILKK